MSRSLLFVSFLLLFSCAKEKCPDLSIEAFQSREGVFIEPKFNGNLNSEMSYVYRSEDGITYSPYYKIATSQFNSRILVDSNITKSRAYFYKVSNGQCVSKPITFSVVPKKPTKLFPNPSSDIVNVEFQHFNSNFDIEIYDRLGRLIIHNQKLSNDLYSIDVSLLERGVYVLLIKQGTYRESFNFTKQ
jgi:hypothetical protein